jgi:hypothetical protein
MMSSCAKKAASRTRSEKKFVGFHVGVEVVPVFEMSLEGFARLAGDERLARRHPVGDGVSFGGTFLCHWISHFQSQLDLGAYGGRKILELSG